MSVKTAGLFVVSLVLAYLVYLDYGDDESENPVETAELTTDKLQKLIRIVNAEKAINYTYAEMSIPYAQRISTMDTFVLAPGSPETQLADIVHQLAEQYTVTVEQLNVGSPHLLSDGVYSLQADVEVSSFSNTDMWAFFLRLSEHKNGFGWKSYKIKALTDDKKILLSGELAAILVQSVE